MYFVSHLFCCCVSCLIIIICVVCELKLSICRPFIAYPQPLVCRLFASFQRQGPSKPYLEAIQHSTPLSGSSVRPAHNHLSHIPHRPPPHRETYWRPTLPPQPPPTHTQLALFLLNSQNPLSRPQLQLLLASSVSCCAIATRHRHHCTNNPTIIRAICVCSCRTHVSRSWPRTLRPLRLQLSRTGTRLSI